MCEWMWLNEERVINCIDEFVWWKEEWLNVLMNVIDWKEIEKFEEVEMCEWMDR